MLVEKRRGVERQRIPVALLGKHSDDGQEVAKNAHTSFGGLTAFRNLRGGRVALADGGEHLEFDRGFQSLSALVRIDCLEE